MHNAFTIVAATLIVSQFNLSASGAEPTRPDEIHTAITRSVRFLQDDMRQWRDVRKCGACHHAPLALVTLREAAAQGVDVDQTFYADLRRWSLTNERARLVPRVSQEAESKPDLSLQSVYLAWFLAPEPAEDYEWKLARQRIGEHLAKTQQSEGFWRGPVGHPPVFVSPSEVTLMVLIATKSMPDEMLISSSILQRAETWLSQQPATDSHQELVFRTLWSLRVGRKAEEMDGIRQLISEQQPDGGWRQTAGMSSDAFATGQSLVALSAAGVSAADPAIQRAAQFLVKTQNPDGTWTMTSRPDPEDGKPAENLNPITYAGTAWATRGLLTQVQSR